MRKINYITGKYLTVYIAESHIVKWYSMSESQINHLETGDIVHNSLLLVIMNDFQY